MLSKGLVGTDPTRGGVSFSFHFFPLFPSCREADLAICSEMRQNLIFLRYFQIFSLCALPRCYGNNSRDNQRGADRPVISRPCSSISADFGRDAGTRASLLGFASSSAAQSAGDGSQPGSSTRRDRLAGEGPPGPSGCVNPATVILCTRWPCLIPPAATAVLPLG